MSNDSPERLRRIADIEATLRFPVPDSIRRQMEDELHTLISFGVGSQFGDVSVGDVVGGDKLSAGNIADSTAAIGAGASASNVLGRVDVSGTVYGAVVGVNQGTINVSHGPPAPTPAASQPAAPEPEQVAAQRERLAAHRAFL